MRRRQAGYSLAEMMIGLFAFSLILGSVVFLISRWQQTTAVTRMQRTLSMEAREAMRQIMDDVREASYIYHWTELDVVIASDEIPGYSAFDPYQVETGVVSTGGKPAIPAIAARGIATGTVDLDIVPSMVGQFGWGESDLPRRLSGTAVASCSTLALASLSDGGLERPKYVVYFAVPENGNPDRIYQVYRFQFQPSVDAEADTWYPMNQTFTEQEATRSLTIRANPGGAGTIARVTGPGGTVNGTWQLRRMYASIDRAPNNRYVSGLFYIQQLHPWSNETPISPLMVEAAVIPAKRYGNRIATFALFDRGYARNVAMPSAR